MWGSLKLTNADLTSQLQGQGAGALNACTLHVVKGKLSLDLKHLLLPTSKSSNV